MSGLLKRAVDMQINIPEQLLVFLNEVKQVSLGYNELRFLTPEQLEQGQIGYRVDAEGRSLVTGEEEAWEEGWLVIANDRLNDPFFIDVSTPEGPVMTAAEGEGTWDPLYVADSLAHFREIITALQTMAEGRSDPASLIRKPISAKERQEFIKMVTSQNPGSDIWYWEDFLDI